MMSLATDFDLMEDEKFLRRVTVAVMRAARNIYNEDPATPNHANRITWSRSIKDKETALDEAADFVLATLSNQTIVNAYAASGDQASIPDGDIEFVVASWIDNIANARAAESAPVPP